jgi:hypothetical protein
MVVRGAGVVGVSRVRRFECMYLYFCGETCRRGGVSPCMIVCMYLFFCSERCRCCGDSAMHLFVCVCEM